ncbi:DUF2059 domain-containing protein [Aurantimonas sp. 22II-16-19i]|uniref:DUF2059 domain-containing protein n=1 Tax=Aurantimonas sp. 22II-16-19i TaxID=1317114 RepID=UPI0009F7C542|nr:DUF2059 domain-containing protein [Aurantimonas sp. 22II-16-19i]ORE97244.1 hypothetical protein ATO4_09341 [Aurantimonas sp. 22II-16-19i]
MIFSQSMRRGVVAAATAMLLLPAAASAQQANDAQQTSQPAQDISESHLAAARAAVTAIRATDQFDEILPNAATQIKSELINNRPDMEQQISDMVDDAAIALAPRRADLETEVARIYARIFSEDELKSIASFYSSGAGEKLLAQGPQATRGMLQAAELWSRGIVRDLRQAAFDEFRAMNGGAAPQAEGAATGAN